MALVGSVLARSHGAGDSGAYCHFCAGIARLAWAIDDSILLPCCATKLPRVDHARVVVRFCDRVGAVPRID